MKKPILPEDYLELKKVNSIEAGRTTVAWVQVSPSPADKSYTSHIRLLRTDSNKIRQITLGNKQDRQPKFSPDGSKFLFISNRAKKPQVYLLDLEFGGEAIQLTKHPNGVTSATWSPDSKRVAYTAPWGKDDSLEERQVLTEYDRKRLELEEQEKKESLMDPYVTESLVYREGTSYHDHRKELVYLLDLDSKSSRQVSSRWTNHVSIEFLDNHSIVAIAKTDTPPDLSKRVSLLKFDLNSDLPQEGKILASFTSFFGTPIAPSSDGKSVVVQRINGESLAGATPILSLVDTDTGEMTDWICPFILSGGWMPKPSAS